MVLVISAGVFWAVDAEKLVRRRVSARSTGGSAAGLGNGRGTGNVPDRLPAPVGTNDPFRWPSVVRQLRGRSSRGGDMKSRTAQRERRSGIRWLVAGALVLAGMLGMWWLVATTNREGTHDAELLPLFALIPLLIGLYHLVRARLHHE